MNGLWKTIAFWWRLRQFAQSDLGAAFSRYAADEHSEMSALRRELQRWAYGGGGS